MAVAAESHESVKNEPLNFASNRGAKSFINEFLHLTNQDYNQEMLMDHIIYVYFYVCNVYYIHIPYYLHMHGNWAQAKLKQNYTPVVGTMVEWVP